MWGKHESFVTIIAVYSKAGKSASLLIQRTPVKRAVQR
jgi:hypothetical protein